jgi:hypothetical protein
MDDMLSKRGTTPTAKIAWTLAYWAISAAPVLLFVSFLYNWGGERDAFENWVRDHPVKSVVQQLDRTPSPAPSHPQRRPHPRPRHG